VGKNIATRLEKAVGIRGYDGIANVKFNGKHNDMAKERRSGILMASIQD
jgi:catalase